MLSFSRTYIFIPLSEKNTSSGLVVLALRSALSLFPSYDAVDTSYAVDNLYCKMKLFSLSVTYIFVPLRLNAISSGFAVSPLTSLLLLAWFAVWISQAVLSVNSSIKSPVLSVTYILVPSGENNRPSATPILSFVGILVMKLVLA